MATCPSPFYTHVPCPRSTVLNTALTTTIVGVLKGVFTTVGGFFFLNPTPPSPLNLAGVVLNTLGGTWYTWLKYTEKPGKGGGSSSRAGDGSSRGAGGGGEAQQPLLGAAGGLALPVSKPSGMAGEGGSGGAVQVVADLAHHRHPAGGGHLAGP